MESSLKAALNRMILVTFGLVCLVSVAFIFSYSEIKQTLMRRSLEEALRSTQATQVEALLPSFLVPEQKAGIPVLLERFKENEQLEQIGILNPQTRSPPGFSECVQGKGPEPCTSDDRTQIGLMIPILESGREFGYLFKAKHIPNPLLNDHLLPVIQVLSGVLLLAFLMLFLFVGRFTSHDFPAELSNLALWLEQTLSEKTPEQMPRLKYKELSQLGKKITEIVDRHARLQDQAMVGQLTSGIMHDIRTPLHTLVTAMYLADEQPATNPKRNARLEDLLKVCFSKVPMIGEIIETTLDANRDIAIAPQSKDLRTTVTEAIAPYFDLAKKRNINVELALGENPAFLHHDSIQMGRVFSNIFKNAIEALEKTQDKDIKISMEWDRESRIKVLIEDSGPGFNGKEGSLFRILRSSKPRGSGLGLVVSRKIVEAHRGKLVPLKSNYLQGARFEVVLPIRGEGV